jgi:hypothetical protein
VACTQGDHCQNRPALATSLLSATTEYRVHVEVIHSGGHYVDRLLAYLKSTSPEAVSAHQVPAALPPMLDDPAEFLPPGSGQADVIIAVNLHPELLVEVAAQAAGRALIAPIEDPSWVRPGLQRQVTQVCSRRGIETAFPKPFCALVPSTPAIAEFCAQFRAGRTEITLTISDGRVAAVEVLRGAPCGLTAFLAQKLIGLPADDSLPERAGILHHTYPCLATMNPDPATGDTVMHASLHLVRTCVAEALARAGANATVPRQG